MARASHLLREAATVYDSPDNGLRELARTGRVKDFRSGGEWMRAALKVLRNGNAPDGQSDFQRLGFLKYGLALTGALPGLLLGCLAPGFGCFLPALLLTAAGFYIVEAQMVFAFPAALDDVPAPCARSRTLVFREGGTFAVMTVVLPLAFFMLTGGLRGQGWVRSWALGCLGVLIWYEQLLARNGGPRACTLRPEEVPLLDIGHRNPLLIRRETLSCGVQSAVRILYASDFHWRKASASQGMETLLATVDFEKPDLILLGGDYVESRGALSTLSQAVARLVVIAPVVAMEGNHDLWTGRDLVRTAIEAGGGHWLGENPVQWKDLEIHGANVRIQAPAPENSVVVRVSLIHNPADYGQAALGSTVIFAGHLHGCQVELWERAGRSFPGAWFYKWNGRRFKLPENQLLYVSRGIGDTLPLRWNCPREVVSLLLQPNLNSA